MAFQTKTLEEAIPGFSREKLVEVSLRLQQQNQDLKEALQAEGKENCGDLRRKNRELADENDRLKQQVISLLAGSTTPVIIEDEGIYIAMLNKMIAGGLHATISAHGAITASFTMSAAKRISNTVLAGLRQNKLFQAAIFEEK